VFRLLAKAVNPFDHGDAPRDSSSLIAWLRAELRPFRFVLIVSLLTTVAGAAIEIWLIAYAARLVDTLAATSPADLWRVHGLEFTVAAAVVLVLRPLLHLVNEGLDDISLRANLQTRLIWRAHLHVSRQSVGWFRNDLAGRIATWVRDGAQAGTTSVYVVCHTLAYVGVYIAGSFWVMGSGDPRLMVPLGLWLLLYAGLMAYVVPRYRRASQRRQEADSALTGLLVDSYANVDTLALLGTSADRDRATFADAREGDLGVQRLEVTMNVAMMTLSGILTVGLAGYGLVLWQAGAAQIGVVAAGLALTFRITAMAEWLLDAVSALFGSLGALRQALTTIAAPLSVTDRPGAGELVVTGGEIRIREVSHHYGNGVGGLAGLSLTISAGEKVALVGRSGAGKSTLVNLLLRFFEPESGSITIDGQDLGSVTQASLRAQIAMVTQEATLLHRSVRENIAASGEVTAAARMAQADQFIATLRDDAGRSGYDAHVGERGVRLSGGQRQRVALARAIHKNAPIVILDEATSALDSEVEGVIQETLDEVTQGRTVIAIAHRLSTIARMDRIVVLDAGRVAEMGTHQELLALEGLYASLWAHQSGGFLGLR
jgi:ATP-binding cassette subfamily B multidrug efflux pump